MQDSERDLARRLARVREAMADAVARRGSGATPTLLAVSKLQPIDRIREAMALGVEDLAESYAQELRDKQAAIGESPPRWHFIGALQSNKLKLLVGHAILHTIDRVGLVEQAERRAAALGITVDTLVQVNLAGEHQKAGAAPHEVPKLLDAFASTPRVRCTGFMLIPPAAASEPTRAWFRGLRELRDRLAETPRVNVHLRELSMGMTGDFEIAIEEGATMVRIGTAIFGERIVSVTQR